MLNLQTTHPWLYHKFSEGLFVVRRSDRFWPGLWPDLTIEQVMMRALKSRGGLTRGSGFTESVCTLWIYSMHATASYHDALSSLTKIITKQVSNIKISERVVYRETIMIFRNWLHGWITKVMILLIPDWFQMKPLLAMMLNVLECIFSKVLTMYC